MKEYPAKWQMRAPVSKPALHLHLSVRRRLIAAAQKETCREAFDGQAAREDVTGDEDCEDVDWRAPTSRIQPRVEVRPIVRVWIAVEHTQRYVWKHLVLEQLANLW